MFYKVLVLCLCAVPLVFPAPDEVRPPAAALPAAAGKSTFTLLAPGCAPRRGKLRAGKLFLPLRLSSEQRSCFAEAVRWRAERSREQSRAPGRGLHAQAAPQGERGGWEVLAVVGDRSGALLGGLR